ncbi:hypothetical protein GC194_12165 [bacterium]|nr:hypothetical protein [bacterium]
MKYTIKLTEEDYLTYQLFTFKNSKSYKQRLRRTTLLMPGLLLVLAFLMHSKGTISYAYGILAIAFIAFGQSYLRWTYKKHFQKHIKTHYANKTNMPIHFGFDGNEFVSKDDVSDARIKLDEFAEITELKDHIFLKINTGDSLIIPRRMDGFDDFYKELMQVAETHDIALVNQKEWKW